MQGCVCIKPSRLRGDVAGMRPGAIFSESRERRKHAVGDAAIVGACRSRPRHYRTKRLALSPPILRPVRRRGRCRGPADRPQSDLSFYFVLLWLFRRTFFAEQVVHHKNKRSFNDQGAPLSHEVAVMRM
jgi:hypothetical protein